MHVICRFYNDNVMRTWPSHSPIITPCIVNDVLFPTLHGYCISFQSLGTLAGIVKACWVNIKIEIYDIYLVFTKELVVLWNHWHAHRFLLMLRLWKWILREAFRTVEIQRLTKKCRMEKIKADLARGVLKIWSNLPVILRDPLHAKKW